MKKIVKIISLFFISVTFAQTGHLMQGVGAVNMSMGGASTAQPIDISGALQWNPASISTFNDKIIKLDVGLFFSSPKLSSSLPAGIMFPGSPAVSGTTLDDKGISIMPAIAMVFGKEDSKHTFGVSAFGISGFGVVFPEESNNPFAPGFNPTTNSNPVNYPQAAGGFGHVESNYMLLQVGLTWAYELSDKVSIGFEPTVNYAALELAPNPTSNPNASGYPKSDKGSSIGFGGQVGVFYDSKSGLKLGASYKSKQTFGDMTFNNTYLDNSTAQNKFRMDYPAIYSLGLGYSKNAFDIAFDFRHVDYKNTAGFAEKGWTSTGSVAGFGWKNMQILSAGFQYKGIKKLPLRIGYTYSTNPIDNELAFFSIPATAVIKHAYQFGFTYEASDNFSIDAVYHHGSSDGKTEGQLLNPLAVSPSNPYGALPGTTVGYEMSTDLIMIGLSYKFDK